MLAAGLERFDLLGVAKIGDVDFVELQVPAPGGRKGMDRVVVCLAQVGEKLA